MTRKRLLLTSTSPLCSRVAEPRDYPDTEWGRFWREMMFGRDGIRGREFTGLQPRLG